MEIRIVLRGALHSGATVLDFHQLPWRRHVMATLTAGLFSVNPPPHHDRAQG